MADRSVTARLRLVYNEFTKGTKAAADGLKGIGDQAKKTSSSVGRDWGAIGKSVAGLGDSLTTRVSLPLVGLGAVAVNAANDFDKAFVQMQTLAGVSADEVDGLKESVLGLAGETGKAPQELAEAMFFLQSSGLDAAGAMDALEISAKASAAGLGDTVTLADAASSVMLAYADSGMTAAEAMDTLIATAKAGKAEPEAIAGQLSKLIPISAALDISFQDVGGALAALSTKAFTAEQGATGLAAVMAKLMKPSQQAQEQLDAVGLSGDRLKDLLAEKGLLGTLTTLKERLGDNGFTRFLEDQEAIRAGVALTNGDMSKMEEIFGQVADSAGSTEEAFGKWAESMGAKNAKAFAQFQIALIRLGDEIAPIAADLMAFAGDVVAVFAKLPEPVQKLVIALAGVLAVSGPLASAGGRVMKAWDLAMKALDHLTSSGGKAFADAMNAGTEAINNLGGKMSGLKAAAGAAAGAAGIGAVLFAIDEMGKAAHAARIADLVEEFVATKNAAETVQPAIDGAVFSMGDMADIFDELLALNPVLAQQYLDQAEALGLEEDKVRSAQAAIDQKKDAEANAAAAGEEHQDEIRSTTEEIADQEQAINEAAAAFAAYADQVKATFDPVFGLIHAIRQNDEAQRAVQESLAALNEARKEHGRNSAEAKEAEIAYQDALFATGEAAEGVQVAAASLNAAVAENPALLDSAKSSLEQWVAQGLITEEQARFLAEQFDITALKSAALGETDPTVEVSETGSVRTRDQLTRVENRARAIPTSRNTHLSTSGYAAAASTIGSMISLISQVPTTKTVNLQARVGAGWGSVFGLTGGRAQGGPVSAGRLYEVAEQGRAELLRMQGRTFLIPGSDGYVDPALSGHMTSGAAHAGANVTNITIDMGRAMFVGDERRFQVAVVKAVNTAMRKSRGLNAA